MIHITRLCKSDFFEPTTADFNGNKIVGIWVFILGAENQWSLNHREYTSETLKSTKIDKEAVVYDFMGQITTPIEVLKNALKLSLERGTVKFDHEDAGFFIPIKSFKNVYTKYIHDTLLTLNDLK